MTVPLPAARLLDLTRLVSRLGKGPLTGIDRVELAYLQRFLIDPVPLYALVRTASGFVLLDRAGAEAVQQAVQSGRLEGEPDLLGRLGRRRDPRRALAESWARRLAIGRAARPFLRQLLVRHVPPGTSAYAVGHANLTRGVMQALRRAIPNVRLTVLVHDTIPLDHPEMVVPTTPASFGRMFDAVAAGADRLIFSSRFALEMAGPHLRRAGGGGQPAIIAPLGVTTFPPDAGALPGGAVPPSPYFVFLSTIDGRKNHALLLQVWDLMACDEVGPMPALWLVGRRGWNAEDVLARLDGPSRPPCITEASGLSDAAVSALLQGSAGLLFPSRVEGFGLPPYEAAALGVPVIASNLEVLREGLGEAAVYLDPDDPYAWVKVIRAMLQTPRNPAVTFVPPTWADHFETVLTPGW